MASNHRLCAFDAWPHSVGLRIQHCYELWCRPAGTVPIQPLAWEFPYATCVALKKKKKKKKKETKKKMQI